MTSLDTGKFAGLITSYSLEVEAGNSVLVHGPVAAEPLMLSLQRSVLEAGAWPLLVPVFPGQVEEYAVSAVGDQLESISPAELARMEKVDRLVRIGSAANPSSRELSHKVASYVSGVSQALRAHIPRYCITFWPNELAAERAGMSPGELESFVSKALFLDTKEPAETWRALGREQQRFADRLSQCRTLRVEADRTDLTLEVGGRTWINSEAKRNLPSGEVFTGPLENSARGRIYFGLPSRPAPAEGHVVTGVDLEFEDGVVVGHSAEEGGDVLSTLLDTDAGARRLGEVGIGTNFGIDRAIGVTLFDEKIGGTLHLALGRSYPETGGTNQSRLHWDLICDLRAGGRLYADGELIQENGKFLM